MLNEEALERLSERLVDRIEDLNLFMINKLGEQINRIGTLTPTQLREVMQSIKYGNDINEIVNKIAEITNKSVKDIYDIFEEVAKKNQKFAKQFYEYKKISYIPYDNNVELKNMVNSLAKITADKFTNIAETSAYAILNSNGELEYTKLSEVYQKITDEAILNISMGRDSFDQTMKNVMKELTSKGIQEVNYSTGYHRRLDSSVRMNLNDGIKNLSNELQKKFGEEFGANGIEVVHHIYPAPDHSSNDENGWYDIDGKQFSIEEFEKVNNSLNRQVSDLNCKHLTVPIILEISKPLYNDKQLEEDKKINMKGFEYEGTHYTMYEGTQLQRQLETKIRQYKDRQIGARAINDSDEVYHCQEKINQLTQKYKELSDISGLPTKIERLRVEGYKSIKMMPSKHIIDTLQSVGIKADNSLVKMDKDLLKRNAEQIEKLSKKYDIIDFYKNNDSTYYLKNTNEYIGAISYNRDMTFLNINSSSKYFRDKDVLIKNTKEMVNNQWFMPCLEENYDIYAMTHEFGHTLEMKLFKKQFPNGNNIGYTNFANRVKDDILKIAKENNSNMDLEKLISIYGRKDNNSKEFFAECFANMELGKSNELGNAMKEYLINKGAVK